MYKLQQCMCYTCKFINSNLYHTCHATEVNNYNTSLSLYTTNQCTRYITSLVTYIGNYNTNLSLYAKKTVCKL